MNKEQIEQLALEIYKETDWTKPMSVEQTVASYAIRFLARVDAERAKEGQISNRPNGFEIERQAIRYCEEYGIHEESEIRGAVVNAFCVGAKLHTQPIPEGYRLVPIEPAESLIRDLAHILSEWLDDEAPLHERRYLDPAKAVHKAILAAAPEVKP